jgi:hypothetical protein
MTFDISRSTFNSWNDYLGVVMQQGRVHLDSDWNELLAELTRRIHAGTLDIAGLSGVPSTTPGAFQIQLTPADSDGDIHLTIGVGRIYVDGILAENHGSGAAAVWDPTLADYSGSPATPTDFTNQPYLRGAALPALGTGPYLVYLDVWQADVGYLQDPNLVDPAVGTDTTGRIQTVWQVRLLDVSGVADGFAGSTPDANVWNTSPPIPEGPVWQALTQGSPSMLTNGPASGYTGQENQLYRVEIHESGAAAAPATLPVTYPLASGTATFKWSRENASVTTAVSAIASVTNSLGATASKLTVQSLGRDQTLGFSPGDWIEITDDFLELDATGTQAGELHQIDSINAAAMSITLDAPVNAASFPLTDGLTDPTRHTRIARWDQNGTIYLADGQTPWATLAGAGNGEIPVPPPGVALLLENGVTVAFDLNGPGAFQAGDFWTFAARTADGSIAPLTKACPFGISHHVSRLAILDLTSSPPAVTDCRTVFQALANRAIHVNLVNPLSGVQLSSGGSLNVQDLVQGLSITFDSPIDPAVETAGITPPCFITVQLPDATNGWFHPVIIAGGINVGDASSRSITWMPTDAAIANLPAQVVPGTPVIASLTLKGDAIWASGGPPFIYLNGAGIGDGRSFADYNLPFALNSLPPVSISATTLSFTAQTVGTLSTPQPVTVSNNSGGALTFSDTIAVSGPNAADFLMTTSCDAGLAANSTCSISVTFSPQLEDALVATRTASISISESIDGDANPKVINLTGTALAPWASPSSSSLSFAPTVVGQATFLTVTITNTGTAPLSISAIQPVGSNPDASSAISRAAGRAAAKSAAAKITDLKFSDIKRTELKTTDVKLTDVKATDLKTSDFKTADLKVTDIKAADVKTGDKTFEIKVTDVKILQETLPPPITGTGFGDFSQTSTCLGNTLSPGQQCVITVKFAPTAVGLRSGWLSVTHNASTLPLAIVLTGSGILQKLQDIKALEKAADRVFNPVLAIGSRAPATKRGAGKRKSFITPKERPATGPAHAEPKGAKHKARAKTKTAHKKRPKPR